MTEEYKYLKEAKELWRTEGYDRGATKTIALLLEEIKKLEENVERLRDQCYWRTF